MEFRTKWEKSLFMEERELWERSAFPTSKARIGFVLFIILLFFLHNFFYRLLDYFTGILLSPMDTCY